MTMRRNARATLLALIACAACVPNASGQNGYNLLVDFNQWDVNGARDVADSIAVFNNAGMFQDLSGPNTIIWNRLGGTNIKDSWFESYNGLGWNPATFARTNPNDGLTSTGYGPYPYQHNAVYDSFATGFAVGNVNPHQNNFATNSAPNNLSVAAPFSYGNANGMGSAGIQLNFYDPTRTTHGTPGDEFGSPDPFTPGAIVHNANGFFRSTTGISTALGDAGRLYSDYLSLVNNAQVGGPVAVKISGLNGRLAPNHNYMLYLWGQAANNLNQNSEFSLDSLDGVTGTWLATTNGAPVTFFITTGATVADDFWVGWRRIGGNTFASWNGFAFADMGPAAVTEVVPEPGTFALGLVALAGLVVVAYCRRRRND